MNQRIYVNYRNGFTLVEILLVVTFTILTSLGMFLLYENVKTSHSVNTESKNMDIIRTGIKTMYGSANNYSGISNQILNEAKIIPEYMQTEGVPTSITNSFGRATVILPLSLSGSATNNAFSMVYLRVPSKICTKLIKLVGKQFATVSVNSLLVKDLGNMEIDIVATSSACAANAGNDVDIIFTST